MIPFFLQIYLGVQAILGILMLEWTMSRNKRFMEKDEARDYKYSAFRRYDSKNWKRWKFYPGAILWMPTRFFSLIFTACFIVILTAPVTCGHNFRKGPMKKGCKKTLVKWIYKFFCALYVAIAGMRTSKIYQDCDYSYYLGPNYKDNYKQIARTSTIVPNHTCWLDSIIMIKYFCPAFAPGGHF